MHSKIAIINAFLEDTSVLVVIAYLLARGRLLTLLFATKRDLNGIAYLGVVLGLVGCTEVVFPGARAPYVGHTLIITFAALVGGIPVAGGSILVVLVAVAVLGAPPGLLDTGLSLMLCALIGSAVGYALAGRNSLLRALLAGAAAQSGVVALHHFPGTPLPALHGLTFGVVEIAANGFGVMVLQVVVNEARTRADSHRNRVEAERAQTLVAEAQLTALRARIHPHFLYNALTSVAALCSISPERAETATLRLSQLMRRTLEAHPARHISVSEEMEFINGYLEIEQLRLGSRLHVERRIDPGAAHLRIPAFALQTLVENAISHGIAGLMSGGSIRISVQRRAGHTLFVVADNGSGLDRNQMASSTGREHGLKIVHEQLILLYGAKARIRLISRPERGTIASFAIADSAAGSDILAETQR
jgi:LytS/YehU family sensor histidine kinase